MNEDNGKVTKKFIVSLLVAIVVGVILYIIPFPEAIEKVNFQISALGIVITLLVLVLLTRNKE